MSPQSISLSVILLTSTVSIITQVESLNFSFPRFGNESKRSLILSNNSDVAFNAIWMGPHEYDRQLSNQEYSGRAVFNQQLNLWDQKRGMEASFRSSFEVSVINMSSSGGDGYAFILSRNSSVPKNSTGQWLGIVNSATVGESNNVVAVEFDTRKSFQEDIDNNHVGLDINSIYSVIQESVGPGTYLWNGSVFTSLEYDASIGRISISMRQGGDTNTLFYDVRLSEHLPEFVFVGFCAATRHVSQMVSVRSWSFTSSEVITARNDSDLVFVWIIVPVVAITSLIGFSWVLYRKKKQQRNQVENDPQIEQEIQSSSTAPHKFRLKELKSATQNFNPMNQLGKGGFGTVYKGILCDKEVAVKRISKNSRHGKQDFIAEITTIGNLNHKNLVKLMGWCYGSNELLLVYEFMPNGSLDKLLFGSELEESVLTWETRHGIISDVEQGLDYLHYGCEKRVLHRDIKASNIMLDSDFNARIGDFGLARTIHLGENSHHSTKEIAGTPGYMAPESFHTGKATIKSDVYAFGVLVLEIVCGKRPRFEGRNIIDWVWDHYRMKRVVDVTDNRVNGNFDTEQTECVLTLGLACCHPNPYERPSIRTILKVLKGDEPPPDIPEEKPAFIWPAIVNLITREASVQILSGGQLSLTMEFSGR